MSAKRIFALTLLALAICACASAQPDEIFYRGQYLDAFGGTKLKAEVSPREADVEVWFWLDFIPGFYNFDNYLTRQIPPDGFDGVETNPSGKATAVANIPEGVYTIYAFSEDPSLDSDYAALTVYRTHRVGGQMVPFGADVASGVVGGGKVVPDPDCEADVNPCDCEDRVITFGLLIQDKPLAYTSRFVLTDTCAPLYFSDADGLVPDCWEDWVFEVDFIETVTPALVDPNATNPDLVTITGKGQIEFNNGGNFDSYPFRLVLDTTGRNNEISEGCPEFPEFHLTIWDRFDLSQVLYEVQGAIVDGNVYTQD